MKMEVKLRFPEFIEGEVFARYREDYLSDDDLVAVQVALALYPELGDLIPRSGGLRKMRWPGRGKGKRGGFRIIYYWKSKDGEIWLLTVYGKDEMDNIPDAVLRELRKEIDV